MDVMSINAARSPRRGAIARLLPALLLCGAIASPAIAQEETSGDRVGLADFDQTTILDNVFNPALSFVGDFVVSYGDKDAREAGADGFLLRSAELGIFGAVDNLLEYHGIIFFDAEEVELEEAYVIARDWLPDRLSLKAGRYNIDFGKQSPIHDHDLRTLDKPSVLQEYIGGNLRGTGAELHWWTPMTEETLFRASLGVLQSADSDAHVVLGPAGGGHHGEEEEEEEAPIRELDDFAVNLRATALMDISEESTVQLGTSFLYAPSSVFGVDEADERINQQVAGIDLTFTSTDETDQSGWLFQSEILYRDAEEGELDDNGTPGNPADDTFTLTSEASTGLYLLAEHRTGPRWSFGASGNFYESAEDSDEERSDIGVFATYNPNEFNRIRFEVRSFEDLEVEDEGVVEELDFVSFAIQWTVILGSHGHGLEW